MCEQYTITRGYYAQNADHLALNSPFSAFFTEVARIFPADRRRGLRDRIVVYRLPITLRCPPEEVGTMTRRVLVERISHILALPPDEIDDAMH